jgi:hypothetical protein
MIYMPKTSQALPIIILRCSTPINNSMILAVYTRLSDNLLCGLYALQLSMGTQHPDVDGPTIAELQAQFGDPEYQARSLAAGLTNTTTLLYSQLVAILYLWGQQRGLNLQVVAYQLG